MSSGTFTLAKLQDYGHILEYGYGEPSDDIKKMMEEKYGFIHQD